MFKTIASYLLLFFSVFHCHDIYAQSPVDQAGTEAEDASQQKISGPYIFRPDVIALLDQVSPDGNCGKSGKLSFACLIQSHLSDKTRQTLVGSFSNPFNLSVAKDIRATIEKDLRSVQNTEGVTAREQIHEKFLSDPESRIELVGIVNRIDRQFILDIVPGSGRTNRCGEISVIYRFSYSLKKGAVSSRLPATMNVVFSAIPRSGIGGAKRCADVAGRWLKEMRRPADRSAAAVVADLNGADGLLSLLATANIDRIELNIQAYRISAGADTTDLGSTAGYIIRVFRWNPDRNRFTVSFLTNQIDRARILGRAEGDDNSCSPGSRKPVSKTKFIAYLTSGPVLSDIDTGTLNIPAKYLACRALSVSPGGAHRAKNLPFWNAKSEAEQIVSDDQLAAAMKKAVTPLRQFSFVKSVVDLRARLNDTTCTGCHQTRAIAGFHFPGADRQGTPSANAVLLAGSPHFYGDQSRRIKILELLAKGNKLSTYELATSYSARPLNKFKEQLEGTQLLGGWGGACLMPEAIAGSQRNWACKAAFKCVELVKSDNAPGLGTCVPAEGGQIGDALQSGTITSAHFNSDRYTRTSPEPVGDWKNHLLRDTRIPPSAMPPTPPLKNSYYGGHQEFHTGARLEPDAMCKQAVDKQACFDARRDAQTGGFPGGMLRLSECVNLPGEATCGLVASSGFNDCLAEVGGKSGKTLKACFLERTSYSGMRACDAASPCREDYICLKPIGYSQSNGHAKFLERRKTSSVIYADEDFGQQEPDTQWLSRNGGRGDQRGVCIPPYFVFQFRSDGHPAPSEE